MASTVPQIRFFFGVIQAADPSKGIATLDGQNGPVTAYIPLGPTIFSVPSSGETWRYYFDGHSFVLFDRISTSPSVNESSALAGDTIIESKGNILLSAERIDLVDSHGDFFDPVSGRLNRDRLPE